MPAHLRPGRSGRTACSCSKAPGASAHRCSGRAAPPRLRRRRPAWALTWGRWRAARARPRRRRSRASARPAPAPRCCPPHGRSGRRRAARRGVSVRRQAALAGLLTRRRPRPPARCGACNPPYLQVVMLESPLGMQLQRAKSRQAGPWWWALGATSVMPRTARPAVPRGAQPHTEVRGAGPGQHRDAPLDELRQHAQHGALDAVRERAVLHARDVRGQHGVRLAARARRVQVCDPQRNRLAVVAPQQLRAPARPCWRAAWRAGAAARSRSRAGATLCTAALSASSMQVLTGTCSASLPDSRQRCGLHYPLCKIGDRAVKVSC